VRIIKADPGGYLDAWNLLEKSDISFFKKAVSKLEEHISQVMATTIEMRGSPRIFDWNRFCSGLTVLHTLSFLKKHSQWSPEHD
jgi:hypothetical protein